MKERPKTSIILIYKYTQSFDFNVFSCILEVFIPFLIKVLWLYKLQLGKQSNKVFISGLSTNTHLEHIH